MAVALQESAEITTPGRRLFTVDEYQRMARAGIIAEDERVELLNGEIFRMSPMGAGHNGIIIYLTALLVQIANNQALINVQGSFKLDDYSQPQPDIAVFKWRKDYYRKSLAGPEDVLLLIEVSDSTLVEDRTIKLPLYAGAGISEVWIFDVKHKTVEVYTEPADGKFKKKRVVKRGEELAARNLPWLKLSITEVFE